MTQIKHLQDAWLGTSTRASVFRIGLCNGRQVLNRDGRGVELRLRVRQRLPCPQWHRPFSFVSPPLDEATPEGDFFVDQAQCSIAPDRDSTCKQFGDRYPNATIVPMNWRPESNRVQGWLRIIAEMPKSKRGRAGCEGLRVTWLLSHGRQSAVHPAGCPGYCHTFLRAATHASGTTLQRRHRAC